MQRSSISIKKIQTLFKKYGVTYYIPKNGVSWIVIVYNGFVNSFDILIPVDY